MSQIHTLVITAIPGADPDEVDVYLDYSIECPGLTDACRTWEPCKLPESEHDSNRSAGVHHGVNHLWHEGRMVGMDRCYLQCDADDLPDVAGELTAKEDLKPGRYQVEHTFDDGSLDMLVLVGDAS